MVEPGVVDVSPVVTEEGVFTEDVTIESDDGKVELAIDEDTIGETAEGEPISEISVTTAEPPAPATGAWGGLEGCTVNKAAGTVSAPLDSFSKYAVFARDKPVSEIYELEPSGATFDPPITVTFTYDPDAIPEGVSEEDLVISRWEEAVKVVAPPVVAPPVEAPAPAAFSVSNLTVQPAEALPNEGVNISLLVANTGGTEGSYAVVLNINGVKEAEKSVTVAAGDSKTAFFRITREEAGSYSVAVDDLSASFTVVAPPVEKPPVEEVPAKPPINWLLIGGIIAAVVIVAALLVYFLVIRRRAA